MVWTRIRDDRRESARRHRPGVEALDERCLLSTGAGTALMHRHAHAVRAAAHRPQVRTPAAEHLLSGQIARAGQPAPAPASSLERPAGSTTAATPNSFDSIIGAAQARASYGVTGQGMTVAVIDTGVDYLNPVLGGSFGPGSKVVAGFNFASNSPDPMATASQHGTAVAGLIGSSDPGSPGVAPGVNLVALRVVGDNNTAQLGDIARALQWVVDHHGQYNITAVNMSLSDGGNYAQNWFAHDGGVGQQITDLIGQLKAINIPVVAATGNSFSGQQGEGFTSIVSGVISVTATDTSNQLLPDAQRLGADIGGGSATEIAAPGKGFAAPSGSNSLATVDGTSFAAPLVTGSVVLLQQIYQSRFGTLPTVDQLTAWLEQGSDPIHDPVTGITIGRLDIPRAAALIPGSPAPAPAITLPTSQPAPIVVSYVPVVATPPVHGPTSTPTVHVPTPAPAAPQVVLPAAPALPAASSPAADQTLSTIQIFLNGKPVSSATASAQGLSASLPRGGLNALLRAMNAWAMQGQASSGGASVSQVRIWNAAAQPAGGLASGTAFPTGRLVSRMVRLNRFANR
jgi:type VI secretion system secreted protein VgrG